MRIAAGIILIIYGAVSLCFYGPFLIIHLHLFGGDPFPILLMISAPFIITGGVFCLRRKYWKICFASSIILLLFMIFDVLFRFPYTCWLHPSNLEHPWVSIATTIPWAILPLIFVCRRESEWQEISAWLDFSAVNLFIELKGSIKAKRLGILLYHWDLLPPSKCLDYPSW